MDRRLYSSRMGIPAGLGVVFGFAYGVISLARFNQFALSSWDNAIFEQAVRGYAHFGAPTIDVRGAGFNQLGDHFSPILVLIAPFYRLFPSAQTILIAQAVLLAVSVAIIAALAIRHLGMLVGVAIGLAYGASFGLLAAVEVDFHEVAFAAPLLALAGAAYVERRFDAVVVWSLPLILVKEEFGLTVAVIGGVLWLAGEHRRGVVLGAVGLISAVFIIFVLMPSIAPDGSYTHAGSLGGERGIFPTLFDEVDRKAATVLLTIAITGLAALFSPWLLLVLPTFAWRFAGDNAYYWGTEWHYSLVLMPIVFVAMIDAMKRWPQLRWATLPALVVTGFMLVNSPLVALTESETYAESQRGTEARAVLALIPKGASVETDIGLMTHLTTDNTVYWLGTPGNPPPEYVLFDTASNIGSPVDAVAYAQDKYGGEYELLFGGGGYFLAHRL
ncbi:putative membrane protein [Aeromicrobium panaciterrae]|uniref:Membrane protein n=1 Tax=Aeromicrobium panaciterrae TaxID=363861 RepID=A0ABU1ULU4_9ACTN|nr:DUF2079 domain-containing protein [Aeromicrobium panaciterrae]MDR7086153.1 putative membrane protein [Aeromicrobium panaciterrae]